MQSNYEKPYVDVMKFVFAIFIFLLHADIVAMLPGHELISAIAIRLAVPYFFVSSGYFLARKLIAKSSHGREIAHRYCRRLASKLLIFEPISIALALFMRADQMPLASNIALALQEMVFYPRGALWYIQAVIIATLILAPFVINNKEKYVIIPALLLYGFATLGNRYYFLVENTALGEFILQYERVCISTRNGLFVGVPLMLCGCLVARYEHLISYSKDNARRLYALGGILYAICICESLVVTSYSGHDDNALYLSYPLLVSVIFVLTIQPASKRGGLPKGISTKVLRNLSTSIYLLHRPLLLIVSSGLKVLVRFQSAWVTACVSLILISVFCAIVYKKKWQPFYEYIT